MSRLFILCADDYGLAPGVDDAILDLAARGRLSAVSGMVTAPAWRADAARLRTLAGTIDLGLHLTFTGFPPLTGAGALAPGGEPRGQAGLMTSLLAGRVPAEAIRREIALQIDAFADAIGRRPDHVDGHHHAHQFPRVGRLVVEALAAGVPGWRPWLRVSADPLAAIARRGGRVLDAATAALLGRRLRRLARAAGVPVNDGLGGFYDVRKAARYAALFPSFLRGAGARHVVVCHPGHCADAAERGRPWMACREHEYAFFAGPDFAAVCARLGVRVARFAEIGR